ncbi:hypothetical protein YPPY76_4091, partial [Yersinia pestis PY-76]
MSNTVPEKFLINN